MDHRSTATTRHRRHSRSPLPTTSYPLPSTNYLLDFNAEAAEVSQRSRSVLDVWISESNLLKSLRHLRHLCDLCVKTTTHQLYAPLYSVRRRDIPPNEVSRTACDDEASSPLPLRTTNYHLSTTNSQSGKDSASPLSRHSPLFIIHSSFFTIHYQLPSTNYHLPTIDYQS